MKFLTGLFFVFLSIIAQGDNMKTLSFYVVKYVKEPPKINGFLDDPQWKGVKSYSRYYEYFKSNPKPSIIKTEFKMLYGDNGVYLGIINYDENLKALKANYTVRDAERLWTDDCDEIYFDPFGDGVGYSKFVTNTIGTVSDLRRIDAAVTLSEWSGSGWMIKTSQSADAWIVEAFFPWEDLGGKAEPGKVWRFCNARFAYTSGKFVGATSSPGGNYNQPGNFGYLYFVKEQMPSASYVGSLMAFRVAPPWILPWDNQLISCNEPGKSECESIKNVFDDKKAEFTDMEKKIEALLKNGKDKSIAEKFQKAVKGAEAVNFDKDRFGSLKKISASISKLDNIYWELKLQELVDSI
jgi:hypothetical protein